ncbi:LysE family translocator [Corynebacterium suicordis]|uniref:LysE family translocator n=1 Tax=Corynebacterium suicordis TaxID=203264 RepID=UPI0025921092|nr:LysE family translocator [Corynebacterium suicordis]
MLTPGPDLFLVLRLAARSRRHTLAAIAGEHLCLTGWVLLTALGATALLARFPWLLGWVQILGALWLLFMAQSLLREFLSRRHLGPPPDIDLEGTMGSAWKAFGQGFFTNLSNPKVLLYFSSILAPLLPVGAPWWVVLLVVGLVVGESLLIFLTIGLTVSTARMRRKLLGISLYIDLVAGVFFTIAGITLLVMGTSAVLPS